MIRTTSLGAPGSDTQLNRRTFLGAVGATGAVALLPTWLQAEASAATPIGSADGVLVLITMGGGNDGLNTVVPIADGTYYDRRGPLAINPNTAHRLNDRRGLHPALPALKQQWDAGNLAVIEGVGHPDPDLSHFTSMARVMHGSTSAGPPTSGWIGRYIDRLPGGDDPFHGVSIGNSLPLVAHGQHRKALAVPKHAGGLFNPDPDPVYQRQYAALHTMGSADLGLGELGNRLAVNGSMSLDVASRLAVAYDADFPADDELARKLAVCARLINANLGIRVLHVMYGDFDSHAGQPQQHQDRMSELNAAVTAFYSHLDPVFTSRSLLLTNSEFGRRIEANDSRGTDHGAASTWLAIGDRVRGGQYGSLHSLADPDHRGNLRTTVDYRNVYTTVLDQWLGADGSEIVGRSYPDLGFLDSPGGAGTPNAPGNLAFVDDARKQLARLYLAYFLRLPDLEGLRYWLQQLNSGVSLAAISDAFATTPEFQDLYGSVSDKQFVSLVYRNVLQRTPDRSGGSYWEDRLTIGDRRGLVMVGFSESAEFIERTREQIAAGDQKGPVGRLYWAYFRRQADTAGLDYWLSTGLPLIHISDAFSETPEFIDAYGRLNDEGFVKRVYENVMDRPADTDGLTYWKGRLRTGLSRGELMVHFSESDEFKTRRA